VTFEHPYLLLFLVAPLALAWWVWRRQGRRVVLPFDHGKPRSGRAWAILINGMETLPALLLAVVVVILAGPQQYAEPKDKRVMTNIEFCVDISGSMTAKFGEGNRYDASMAAIDEFLNYRTEDAFGLTFFGSSVLHWCPLTNDVSAIRCATPFMRPELVPPWFGGTEIGKALLACKKVLVGRQEGDRMILLISDGFSSDLGSGSDTEIARQLIDENITVFAVLVGDAPLQPELVNITSATGGEIFQASDPGVMESIFKKIDGMKQTRMERTVAETMDFYWPFSLAGLVLLAISTLGSFGLRYTPW
jgi:Ca-activated chloride channel family protein